jgi:hypothetical protein
MRAWVFHEEQLDLMLAARTAERQKEGATVQQAVDESFTIKQFLVAAEILQMPETKRVPHAGIA